MHTGRREKETNIKGIFLLFAQYVTAVTPKTSLKSIPTLIQGMKAILREASLKASHYLQKEG